MPYRDTILAAIADSGRSERDVSMSAVGHESAIRSIKRNVDLRMSTVEAICDELGLELYVGSPRGDHAYYAATVKAADLLQTAEHTLDSLRAQAHEATLRFTREGRDSILRAFGEEIPDDVASTELPADTGYHRSGDLEDVGALAPIAVAAGTADPLGARSVQMIEMAVAAGDGSCDLDTAPVKGPVWFRRDWIDSRSINPTQAVVISVRGESMEPTLPSGCKILVDRERRRRRAGHIYVVDTPDGVVVKRMSKNKNGGWVLVSDSDSPDWPDAPWPNEAEIVGEVKWMARELP